MDKKFTQAEDFGDGRTMHVRTHDANDDGDVVEEVAVVGTDIQAPKATAFGKVYELNERVDRSAVAADTNPADTFDLGDALDGTFDATVLGRVSGFVSSTQAVLTFGSDTSGTMEDEADQVAGTYDGAPGMYRCNAASGASCTVSLDDEGMIIAMSDGWVFTPSAGAMVDVPDTSYLHYGFWLKRTTDDDGVLTYNEVDTFAGASIAPSGPVADVDGTASYSGDAVGVYVHHVLSEGGGRIESSTSGHFKADASLKATFGQVNAGDPPLGTIAPNLLNSITGTIDNFALSGGEQNDWSVNLAKGAIDTSNGTASGMAEGGGASGSYSGTFHGALDSSDPTVQPSAVVGEFNANMSNGSVAGAFGANKE